MKNSGIDAEVINAGYADGWSPDEHYAWLVNEGLRYKPDIIVYGFFIGNDIKDINKFHWRSLDENGLPNKVENPDIYIDSFGRIRSKVRDEKTVGDNGIYRIPLLRESHFIILMSRCFDTLLKNMSPAYDNNWEKKMFPFIFKKRNTTLMQAQSNIFIKLVKGMSFIASQEHADFIVLEIPLNFQVEPKLMRKILGEQFPLERDYFAEINPLFDKMHIRYINLLDKMRKSKGKYFPRNGEVHFNPMGHRFAAEQLANYLLKSGIVLRDHKQQPHR